MTMLTRRTVLGGGALVVAFSLSRTAAGQPSDIVGNRAVLPGSLAKYPLLESWIRVDAEGRITVFTGKAELGQGIKTALLQIAADELAAPPSAIELITADTARTPDEGVTAGSRSMSDSGVAILNAAANVRLLLAEAAAWRFVMAADQVELRDGRAWAPDGRNLGYGELVAGFSLQVPAKPNVPRRPRRDVAAKSLPRVDIPAKLTGGSAFLHDMRLPGMLHARVARGPSDGTRLKEPDLKAVANMPGVVQVVREGHFTAVVATDEWRAVKALHRLQEAGWERPAPPLPAPDMREAVRSLPAEHLPLFDTPGPAAPAGARVIKARYSRPCLMHGAIGPSCAIALWQNDELTVWTHSQGVGPLRRALAELLRMPLDDVRCIHVEGSGCYGHNGADDVAADAALAARAAPGRPVRVQWMREQEHGWEPLGSAMVVEMEGTLADNGRIAGWRHEVWSNAHSSRPTTAGGLLAGAELEPPFAPQKLRPIPMPEGGGARNSIPLYALPNARGVFHFVELAPVRVSALRALGAHMNVFAIECFMDELAQAASADPVAFRLAHLQDGRARDVIEVAAERFGWRRRAKGGAGVGYGFAFARYKNLAAYCAVAMEVAVDRTNGEIRIPRVVAAVDSGEAVSPDGIKNQIEGAIVQSLSWTIHEAVTFEATHRASFDWSGYPTVRFPKVPGAVTVHVVDRPGMPFLGTGEAGQGPAAAALANAVADAVGARVRDMPLTPRRVKAALPS